jgi:transposase
MEGGLSGHRPAAEFGVAPSTVIDWVTKPAALSRGKMGRHKPKSIRDGHAVFLSDHIRGDKPLTLRGLVAELAGRGLKVDYRSVWNFVHAEKLSFKKASWPASAIDLTSRVEERGGSSGRTGLLLSAWSSSTRRGPGPTWSRCADGRRAAKG